MADRNPSPGAIMADRNPSPPPELQADCKELRGGQIGDTLFSQHWLFQALLKAMEYTEKTSKPCWAGGERHQDNSAEADVNELPKDLEDTMCTLWDMSADSDVSHFLVSFKAKDIFLEIIDKTKSPRLLEIVTGILGNMAFFEDICKHFSESSEFVNAVLQLLGTTDTPTLIQVIRLIHVCIANPDMGDVWYDTLKSDPAHLQHLIFVLENSLNADLLKSTMKFVYHLLDEHLELFSLWSVDSFVKAVTVSATQLISSEDLESLVEYWHILHLLSRQEEYLDAISHEASIISQHLRFYASHFVQSEAPGPRPNHVTGLTAAFSTLNSLSAVDNPDIGAVALLKDGSIMQYVKDLHDHLKNKLIFRTEEDLPDASSWELLVDVLADTITLSLQLTPKPGEQRRR